MSEYQYIHFMAIDKPLDDKQLAYIEQQSSRAKITPWELTNEYHYGDFHGNAAEMLRNGYDIHLHFANFGIRRLMIRLPGGPPCERRTFEAFLPEYGIKWIADEKGKAGILSIQPEADAGSYDYLDDVAGLLPEIAPIRKMLVEGDLRPLYVVWLACNHESESLEPPVPAGLQEPAAALLALARFYELPGDLIAAAAKQSPPMPARPDANGLLMNWVCRQSERQIRQLAAALLSDNGQAVRAETLQRIREEIGETAWPVEKPTRTFAQLQELAAEIGEAREQKAERSREAARRKRLKDIAAHPEKLIEDVGKLVAMRSTDGYQQAARQLADLREAIGPELGPARARAEAEKLRRKYPTLRSLISALKKQGLLG